MLPALQGSHLVPLPGVRHRRTHNTLSGSRQGGEAAAAGFLAWLQAERRASPLTVAAYGRDLRFFFGFLSDHLGGPASLEDLDALREADLRAWLAAEARRGLGNRTRARHLSAIRSFFRYLARRHGLGNKAARLIGSPKSLPPVPRALAAEQALAVAREAGTGADQPWVEARDTAPVHPALRVRPADQRSARPGHKERPPKPAARCWSSARVARSGWCPCSPKWLAPCGTGWPCIRSAAIRLRRCS